MGLLKALARPAIWKKLSAVTSARSSDRLPSMARTSSAGLSSKSPADMTKLADQRFDLLLKLKQRKTQERKDLLKMACCRSCRMNGSLNYTRT